MSEICRWTTGVTIMAVGDEEEIEKTKPTLHRVFISGRYIGGVEEVRQLQETDKIKFVEDLRLRLH